MWIQRNKSLSSLFCLAFSQPTLSAGEQKCTQPYQESDFDSVFYNGSSSVTLTSIHDRKLGRKFSMQPEGKGQFCDEVYELASQKKSDEYFSKFWCDDLKNKIPSDAVLNLESIGQKTYRFKPLLPKDKNEKRRYNRPKQTIDYQH